MDANLKNIRIKLASGEKLSSVDLRSLQPLHDAIYDQAGCVVGSTSVKGNEMEVDDLAGEFKLDYLDRSFLGGKGDTSGKYPRLVRYIGKQISKQFNTRFSCALTGSLLTNKVYFFRYCHSSLDSIQMLDQEWSKTNSIQNITRPMTVKDGRNTSAIIPIV